MPGSREIQEGDKVEPLWCMSDLQVHHGVNGMIFWTKGGWGGKGSPAIDDGDNGGPWGEPHREQKGKLPESPASWGGKSLLFGNQQAQLATSTPIPGHSKIHSFPFLASSQLSFCLSVCSVQQSSKPSASVEAAYSPGPPLPRGPPKELAQGCLAVVFAELPSITLPGMGGSSHSMTLFFLVTPILPLHQNELPNAHDLLCFIFRMLWVG